MRTIPGFGFVMTVAMDRSWGGPFAPETYADLCARTADALRRLAGGLPTAQAAALAGALAPVFEAAGVLAEAHTHALEYSPRGGAPLGPGDPYLTQRARCAQGLATLAATVADPGASAHALAAAARAGRSCPPALAARVLAHPGTDLVVLAELALADASTGTRLPDVLRTAPVTVADVLLAAGGAAGVLAQLAPTWDGAPAALADVADAVSA